MQKIQQEQQTLFFPIDRTFTPSPKAFLDLEQFIRRECIGSEQSFSQFLKNLHEKTEYVINLNTFRKFIRIIKKYVINTKSQQLQLLLSSFLIKQVNKYYPYQIKSNKVQQFKQYIQLVKGLKLNSPQTLQNQKEIIIYLQCAPWSQQWSLKLVQKLNNQSIVDKKNATSKSLKFNTFFSGFLVKNIQKIIPQLQRLLVRNQANIEVWEQVLSNITQVSGMQKTIDAILKKIKNFFVNYPEATISIMNAIGASLVSNDSFKQLISFLNGIISNQHNSKKKLNYLKMTKGLFTSIQNLSLKKKNKQLANELTNQVLSIYANSYSKFVEDEQLGIVLELLNELLPLVQNPNDDIAKNLKGLLKNQNKNALNLLALTLSVYNKEQIQNLPSVKQIYTHFKTQIPTISKKLGANWQWFIHIINFMGKVDTSFYDYLSDDLPVFKATCASLFTLQKRLALDLYMNYYKFNIQQQNQISEFFFTCVAVLMEEVKRKEEWTLIVKTLSIEHKLQLISKGIYPLLWYPCKELKKNKGNQFNSLIQFIVSSLDSKIKLNGFKVVEIYKILISCKVCNVEISEKIEFNSTEEKKVVEDIGNKFWKASFYDLQNQEDLKFLSSHIYLIKVGATQILKVSISSEFDQNLQQILKPFNYEKNFQYIKNFEEDSKKCLIQLCNELKQTKLMLFERNFSQQQKPVQKKIYLNPLLVDTKMMSQQQVKAQRFRKHFEKMFHYYESYIKLIVSNIKKDSFLLNIWNNHFSSIIKITQYPEARMPVFILVRKSIQRTFLCLKKQQKRVNQRQQSSRMFLKYSLFFGQFFCIRNSNITPSLRMMEKSSGFLKFFLSIDFSDQFADFIFNFKKQFVMYFINDMCQQILENMQFDLSIKKHTITFYHKCNQRLMSFGNQQILFSHILKNINILSSSENILQVLITIMKRIDVSRYNQLFEDILSYVSETQILILNAINDLIQKHQIQYQPRYEEYIKLKILALEQGREEITKLSNNLIKNQSSENKDILKFNMKNFINKNSKQIVQKLCIFIKQQMRPQQNQAIFKLFVKTFNELFDEKLDQQGLQIFPYFLSLNIQIIKPALFSQIFELLVLKFTSNQNLVTLSRLSLQVGIQIIKFYSGKDIKYAEQILKVLQGFINRSTGVSNIVFLGVLAPFLQGNKNLLIIEKRITQLFKGQRQNEQKAIAKCMPDLMSFFKQPAKLVEKIFIDINGLPQSSQLGQAYLAVGLLKGINHHVTMQYLDRLVSAQYITKTKSQKSARIYLLTAFVEIFGRFIQLRAHKIIEIVIIYMADNIEQIRNIAKKVVQLLIAKVSAYSVKNLLPHLLNGLENEPNWRVKISYIWILGIMANCSARQLQTSLPVIVPTLSTCLSNAHPTIRNKASQALNLIGQTIKNPQISNSIDILIEALQNPFQKSDKALQILLKTRFSHYIDAPSLSIIIPIIDYSLRGRVSELKASSCQVIGSIVDLIHNPYDLLPYLKIISGGLKLALCDPLPEIRSIAAMAVGRISNKIGIKNAQTYFQFILDIIQSPTSNTTQRQGAAQAYSQIICSHDYDYFQQSLNKIFDKLNQVKHSQKQGFILVFLYVPNIKKDQFEGFIRQVNQNMYTFVADEDQNIRNSAMQVEKVLINNYCLTHTDLLLEPLCQGVFETNWRKRNGALILIGQLINIIKNHMYNTKSQDKAYAYYKGIMAVYILKDDELQMPRLTANQVWNTYIQNTPKTIRIGLRELVIFWSKYTHDANGVVFKNIGQFSSKYGQNYFQQILGFMNEFMPDPLLQKGIFEVLTEFIKRLQQQFMMKDQYRNKIRQFFQKHIFIVQGAIRESLAKTLAIWVQKMREQKFFEQLLYPQIEKMDTMNQQNPQYTQCLHLLRDLLHTPSQKVVDRLINKIMQTPLSEFKIEVITNNADRLANQLYTLFKQPATQIFVEEIYTLIDNKQKQNRLSLIVYCLEQVSLKLNIKYKCEFVRMMTVHLRKLIQKKNTETFKRDMLIAKKLLGIIFFFLSSIQISDIQELQILLGQITPLIFVKEYEISENVHKIFQILISNPRQQKTPEYLKQMIVSMQNNANDRNLTVIWDDQQITKNYINILVKCIAYGNSQTMQQALQMMKFLMKFTKRQIIDKQILKIIGPVVRVINYPLLMKQKILLMEFLSSVHQKRFNIQAYSNQILSVCFRLLQQFKTKDQILQCVSGEFQNILTNAKNKNEIMLTIIHKIKVYGTILVETVYYLMKNIILEGVELPKTTYEKVYEQFNHICIHNEYKLPLRGVYYASKTAARVGAFLNIHIETLQTQLKAVTCPYQVVINYLHLSYYKKLKVPKLSAIQVFIKQCPREKVYYLLKSIKLCRKTNTETKETYDHKYIVGLIPEGLSGFEDIIDIVEEFEE